MTSPKFVCPEHRYHRLLAVVEQIANASLGELGHIGFVADCIREAGLSFDPRGIYGTEQRFMDSSRWGAWQMPLQYARALTLLSERPARTFVEIGTFKGWTTTLTAAYLRRFHPELRTITIDPNRQIVPYPIWDDLHIRAVQGTSDIVAGQRFDVCLIDGDHSREWIERDFRNVGQHAGVCLVHDINEELCPDVRAFWSYLAASRASSEYLEYLDHPEGRPIMGIGVIFNR